MYCALRMTILKAGAAYFALVFGIGFVLGTLRVLWILPRWRERMAELLEMPWMLLASFLVARWLVRRLAVPPTLSARLGMGLLALGLLLAAELSLVLWLRGLTVQDYIASRDPVSGTVYLVMLVVFAAMPVLVGRQ